MYKYMFKENTAIVIPYSTGSSYFLRKLCMGNYFKAKDFVYTGVQDVFFNIDFIQFSFSHLLTNITKINLTVSIYSCIPVHRTFRI